MIAELLTPGILKRLDPAEVALGEVGRLGCGDGEALGPLVEVAVSVLDQAVDVAIVVGGEDDADGRHVARRQTRSATAASPAAAGLDGHAR